MMNSENTPKRASNIIIGGSNVELMILVAIAVGSYFAKYS